MAESDWAPRPQRIRGGDGQNNRTLRGLSSVPFPAHPSTSPALVPPSGLFVGSGPRASFSGFFLLWCLVELVYGLFAWADLCWSRYRSTEHIQISQTRAGAFAEQLSSILRSKARDVQQKRKNSREETERTRRIKKDSRVVDTMCQVPSLVAFLLEISRYHTPSGSLVLCNTSPSTGFDSVFYCYGDDPKIIRQTRRTKRRHWMSDVYLYVSITLIILFQSLVFQSHDPSLIVALILYCCNFLNNLTTLDGT